jgi:hypothetical protein
VTGRVGGIASNSNTRFEQIAFIGAIFVCDPRRDWLEALEAGGRLKVGALFTAMKWGVAFGAHPFEIDV